MRAEEVRKNAGDPGLVLPRRLSNAEYNYTIRDLTGQDMQPTREFPVDPANPAGFDNSGESLTMSSALLNKYMQAARGVADHMVLTPDGIDFAPYPMLVETDRDKYAIQRIVDFYLRQPTDYADYFKAAWRLQTSRRSREAARNAGLHRRGFEGERKVSAHGLADSARQRPGGARRQAANHVSRIAAARDRALYSCARHASRCAISSSGIRDHTAMQFAAPM